MRRLCFDAGDRAYLTRPSKLFTFWSGIYAVWRDARTTRSVREISQGNFFARSVIPTLDALAASSSKQPATALLLYKRGGALFIFSIAASRCSFSTSELWLVGRSKVKTSTAALMAAPKTVKLMMK